MNILSMEHDLHRKAVEVYLAGCNRQCPGCHNPESWDFNLGTPWQDMGLRLRLHLQTPLTERLWIMGGEPLDQDTQQLVEFLDACREIRPSLEIWLWTSYETWDVPDSVLVRVNVIKSGRYLKDVPGYRDPKTGIDLASGNQRITKV